MISDWEKELEAKLAAKARAAELRSETDDNVTKKEKKKMAKNRKKRTKDRDARLTPTKRKGSMAKRAKRLAGKVLKKATLPVTLGQAIGEEGLIGGAKILRDDLEYFTGTGDDDNNLYKDLGFAKGGLVKNKGSKRCKCRGMGKATRGGDYNT